MSVVIYHHDPVEVDFRTSWTGLCPSLASAELVDIRQAVDPRVTDLFSYARPDAVIVRDGIPLLSIEQTMMNPSGHNIPQRFSCMVRAAELGVPSIMYCPEKSRRTFSDPNLRYLQVRVPMGQFRLEEIYEVPSLTVFWPTDASLLPDITQSAHSGLARLIDAIVVNAGSSVGLLRLPEVIEAKREMARVVQEYGARYRRNASLRSMMLHGFGPCSTTGLTIDPPNSVRVLRSSDFLASLRGSPGPQWDLLQDSLRRRELTMLFTGTANAARNDSEHPWPGYLTLLDVLYARSQFGRSPSDRDVNLVYRLPRVPAKTFVSRSNQLKPPTATYIVDTFVDAVVLDDATVAGWPVRGDVEMEYSLRG